MTQDQFDYYGTIVDSCRAAVPGKPCAVCGEEAELNYRGTDFCEGCLLRSKFLRTITSHKTGEAR